MDSLPKITTFLDKLYTFYSQNGRHDMPWRKDTRAYYILLSEVMLQQTQVERVKTKFVEFVKEFPDWNSLAEAKQSRVVSLWQGLGYNRRALYLCRCAETVVNNYNGNLPKNSTELQQLPGIGPNTAGAIMAFAYDQPVVFIETNIRRVLLHEFFVGKESVDDSELIPILEKIIAQLPGSQFSSRTFYWAMMDYGTYLKQQVPNPNRRSKHYTKQSQFVGSTRQLRGLILKELLRSPQQKSVLQTAVNEVDSERFNIVINSLLKDGFVIQQGERIQLK